MNSKEQRKPVIVILGPTGAGKSTLGNTLLGYKGFEAGTNYEGSGITTDFNLKEGKFKLKDIIVVDSPGPGDGKSHLKDAISTLYSNLGNKMIDAVIIVNPSNANRLDFATKVALNFAQNFMKDIPPERFWLCVTYP